MDDIRTIRLAPPLWAPVVLLVAVLIGGGFYVYGKKLESRPGVVPTINVTGEGKATMKPDIAELRFGVQVQRTQTAKEAMTKLSTLMTAVIAAVEKTSVETKDIHTESLSLSPAYDWSDGKQTPRGFDASQSLMVKVRNLDDVSDVLAAAANAGANQVGGINFTIDDPEKARAEAREEAITQAKAKAQVLANQLGMKIVKIQSFSEGGGAMPYPMYARGGMAMDMATEAAAPMAPPLPAGEQDIAVQVTITYELE